jgi:hypothetical protein
MPVAFSEIEDAFGFVSMSEFGNSAWVCRETGAIHMRSDWDRDQFEPMPEDIDDGAKYAKLPDPRDLDLGTELVLRFAAERLDEHYDEIAAIFSRKGAYRRFKEFLRRLGALDSWYEFENNAREKALRDGCAENGVEVVG